MNNHWEQYASRMLKAEMARKGWTYEDFNQQLAKVGAVKKTASTLCTVVNRGKFSFAFFLQCAKVLGIEELTLMPQENQHEN